MMNEKEIKSKCTHEKGEGDDDDYAGERECVFEGFDPTNTSLLRRVLNIECALEKLIKEKKEMKENEEQEKEFIRLRERIKKVEENEARLRAENEELKKEVAIYKKQMEEGPGKAKKEKEKLKDLVNKEEERVQNVIQKEVQAWRIQDRKEKTDFQEVIQEQLKEKEENMTNKMIGVLKTKKNLVREIAEKKKSVVVFGIKEKKYKI